MRNLRAYIMLVFIILAKVNVGQNDSCCANAFLAPDTSAVFAAGNAALLKYSEGEIIPIIKKCNEDEGVLISSLKAKLTINCEGKVIKVAILNTFMSESCKNKLRDKFLTMGNWKPALIEGKEVCSVVYFPISCIKWN